jgi:predicted phosphodiesterase
MRILTEEKKQMIWTDDNIKKLLKYRKQLLSNKEIAKLFGCSRNAVNKKISKLRKQNYHIPYLSDININFVSNINEMPVYDKCLKIISPIATVISDTHLPYLDLDMFFRCLAVSKKFKAKDIIIAGDIINADAFSKFVNSTNRKNFREEKNLVSMFFESLLKVFKNIYIVAGNHDLRLFKILLGEVDMPDYMKMFSEHIGKRIKVSGNYKYCYLNDKYLIAHPKQYWQKAPSLPRELASKYQKHIITGHGHHSGICFDKSGNYFAIEIGGLIDKTKIEYNNIEITTHPTWNNSFVIIKNNFPYFFGEKFTDWNEWIGK